MKGFDWLGRFCWLGWLLIGGKIGATGCVVELADVGETGVI